MNYPSQNSMLWQTNYAEPQFQYRQTLLKEVQGVLKKRKFVFFEIAYGSLMEAYNQLLLASDLGYIDIQKVNTLKPKFEEIAKMISGLKRSLLMS